MGLCGEVRLVRSSHSEDQENKMYLKFSGNLWKFFGFCFLFVFVFETGFYYVSLVGLELIR